MNYRDPELRERLAAEYVLGTLRGRARDRFERLLIEDRAWSEAVERWECRLNPLTLAAPAHEPPARVWHGIQQRIQPPVRRSRGWLWPVATGVATAAAIVLVLYISLAPPATRTLSPEFVATIGAETGSDGPRWSVAADTDTRRVSIRTLQPAQVASDKDLELWLLPADGNPISLGLLPQQGEATRAIPDTAIVAAPDASGIAISREPAGGSPTGAPTGPVLFQGQLLRI